MSERSALPDFIKEDVLYHNGVPVEVLAAQLGLPDDPAKRAECEQHVSEGRDVDLVNDFWMAGCHFPEENATDQTIRYQIACSGTRRFGKKCRLTLTQFDTDGAPLTRGGFTGA